MMGYYGWSHVSPGWGGLGLGIFFNVLFGLSIAFVVLFLIRQFVRGGMRKWNEEEETQEEKKALNILKERYCLNKVE